MEKFIIHSQAYRTQYVQFIKYLQAVGYSPSSCHTFKTGIKEFLGWIERQNIISIHQVEEHHIENFYNYQQERPGISIGETLSEKRICINMYILKLFFRYQQDTQQLEINPMNDLSYPQPERVTRENLLSLADIEKLYGECITAKQRAMLGIIYGCGLRRQEAVKLNAKDIHFKSGMLYVRHGKGGRKRSIPLSNTVLNDLKDYYFTERPRAINQRSKERNKDINIDVQAFMFNHYGTRMQGDSYSQEIKKIVSKAKLDKQITLHHFRHAIATHLMESGMKTRHVKDFLGHMSIETTQTYTHIETKEMKKTTGYGTTTIPS